MKLGEKIVGRKDREEKIEKRRSRQENIETREDRIKTRICESMHEAEIDLGIRDQFANQRVTQRTKR